MVHNTPESLIIQGFRLRTTYLSYDENHETFSEAYTHIPIYQ